MMRLAFRTSNPPTPNQLMRMHWAKRKPLCRSLAWQIRETILGPLPERPWPRVRVTMTRHGVIAPDSDALPGCAKILLDILQPPSKRHPYGLGIIANDTADACELVARFVRAKHRPDAHTCVVVEAV